MSAYREYAAPAKLNLMLRVVGRRADGYHLLQTVLRFIDYSDTLRFAVRADGAIERDYELPGIAAEADLVVRAARLLQAATGTALGATIALEKRLPPGGGLGGGSSDAATTLIALNHLWQTGLTRARLQALAGELGADVPVFVFGESAWAEGIGDRLQPISLPPQWYVVLVPPVAVPTPAIFADPELTRDSIPLKIHGFSVDTAVNDLESVACRRYPEVARHLAWLKPRGRALMTGSGACVFAAFDTEARARAVLAELPADMRGFVARGLDRHPLRHLLD
jgi:4-diphosphocytidyl-2-C-methyl-D-erythritol kinase